MIATAPAQELRPGERRDRVLGTILLAAGVLLFLLGLVPLIYLDQLGLGWIRHVTIMVSFNWMYGGYLLRNVYAANLGEALAYRTPRWRRIPAAIFFAIGLVVVALAAFKII